MDHSPAAVVELEDKPCPLCGSSRSSSYLHTRDFLHGVPGDFQIVRCLNCCHLYMNPRPTADTIMNCYPSSYEPHFSTAAVSEATPSQTRRPWYLSPAARRIPGLRALYYWLTKTHADLIPLAIGAGSHVIELGCATGSFLQRLRDAGCTVQGVELVASAAEAARHRGFSVHAGTLESASLESDSFDAAFSWMVVEHLADPRGTLVELRRVLRRDGWLVFSVPNVACWEPYVFGRNWLVFELPRHLQYFNPHRLTQLLIECGYDRVTITHQRNLLNVVGSMGILLTRWFPHSPLARRVLAWRNHPTLWCQLALAPLAIVLAGMRQGGRLTVVARKRAVELKQEFVSE